MKEGGMVPIVEREKKIILETEIIGIIKIIQIQLVQ